MEKKLILLIILFGFCIMSNGQVLLKGKIKSALTGKNLSNVVVNIEDETKAFIESNQRGKFNFYVDSLPATLVFSKLCYKEELVIINKPKKLKVYLSPRSDCDSTKYLFK